MICREITTPDGTKLWLLISQVEHARISGEIVRYWHETFDEEVIEAIAHHDDGWGTWETAPKMNPEKGQPFTFLEMPVAASLAIWDVSIAAARQIGPLAGWIVAGHFYALLNESENADDQLAAVWLSATRKRRTTWIDEWLRADPAHMLDYAKRAQQMIYVADLFSLWLCCDCPVTPSDASILEQSAMKPRAEALLGRYRLEAQNPMWRFSAQDNRAEELAWQVAVEPHPFKNSPLILTAVSAAAPAIRYASWDELAAASWPVDLRWQLVSTAASNGSAG